MPETLQNNYQGGNTNGGFAFYANAIEPSISFTASGNYTITSISLYLLKGNTDSSAVVLTLENATDNHANGTVLATNSNSVTDNDLPASKAWYNFPISFEVTQGVEYCIRLKSAHSDGLTGSAFFADSTAGNTANSKEFRTNNDGGAWVEQTWESGLFKVYGDPVAGIVGPFPTFIHE